MDSLIGNPDRRINLKEICALTGLSRTTIYKLINNGSFFPPEKYGTSSRWRLGDVMEWLNQHRNARPE